MNANDLLNSEVLLKYGAEPIIFQLAPDIPMCLLDPSQFNAAILNLVLNARDATSDSGDVQISTARCVVKIVTEVLPPAWALRSSASQRQRARHVRGNSSKIFDPFFTTKG